MDHLLKKYPKLFFLLSIIVCSIVLFYEGKTYPPLHNFFISLNYFGIFLSGIFYAYGFTAPIGTAVLLVLAKEQNILLAGLIGGLGALLSDILIFLFIKNLFTKEITLLRKENLIVSISKLVKKLLGPVNSFLLQIFAGFIIASPLPTEIGVALIAAQKKITLKSFMLIAYVLHTIGIFIILIFGKLI